MPNHIYNRRSFLKSAGLISVGFAVSPILESCISTTRSKKIEEIWFKKIDLSLRDKYKKFSEIIRCGTFAPSTHNSQPWKFKIKDNSILIYPDFSRRCPVVDPFDRELYISLGCAIENIVIAACKFGYKTDIQYFLTESSKDDYILLTLSESLECNDLIMFDSITKRQTNRSIYDKIVIPDNDLNELKSFIVNKELKAEIFTEKKYFDLLVDYITQANTMLIDNKKYTAELQSWIRYSDSEAEEKLDGLYTKAMGTASAPKGLGKMLFSIITTPEAQTMSDAERINSSSALTCFFSEDNKMDWLKTGQFLQRYLLKLTAMGLKYAFMCQPCQVQGLRNDFAREFNHKGLKPQIALRIGYSKSMPHSPRRKIEDVILQ